MVYSNYNYDNYAFPVPFLTNPNPGLASGWILSGGIGLQPWVITVC